MGIPKIRRDFAKQLRRYRKEAGFTQEEAAERAGMDIRYYQRAESAKPNAIKIDTIDRLAKALQIPAWKLLK